MIWDQSVLYLFLQTASAATTELSTEERLYGKYDSQEKHVHEVAACDR